MADFIVIWKPTGWPHAEILRLVNACQKRGAVDEPWRFKSHRLAKVGDRVFALKQGDGPKSIFGVGSISSEPFRGRATTGKYQWLANVRFTNIVDPLSDALIPEEIVRSVLPNNLIRARSSGMPIENSVATELLKYLVVRPDSIGTRNAVYVTWREGEARGCTDVLALELFQYEGSRNGVIHQVRG